MNALHPLAAGVAHPAPQRHRVPQWVVLAGLVAAPLAWLAQLLTDYLMNGDTCRSLATAPRPTAAVVVGALALVVCGCGLWAAARTWRLTHSEGPGDHHAGLTAGVGRTRFLGLCGLVASAFFAAGVMTALFVPFMVPPCATPLL